MVHEIEAWFEPGVGIGLRSPCKLEIVVVDTGTWMESGVEVEPGSSCEPKVMVENEARFEPRVGIGPGSPCELEVVVEIGV